MPRLFRTLQRIVVIGIVLALATTAGAEEPPVSSPGQRHFPGSGSERLNIQGVVEADVLHPVLEAFHQRYPQITLNYRDASRGARQPSAGIPADVDLLMSSAMAQQYQLANGGNAQPLGRGVINPAWPESARWRDELIGLTHEPLVMVYRRELADIAPPPVDHAGLLALLNQESAALAGRVATYDPARSPTGFMAVAQDMARSQEAWGLFEAMGAADTQLLDSTTAMLEGLIEGRYLIGYNLIGSYARRVVREHSELVLQVPTDYALALQRLALIPTTAPHPETARRFLSFITSRQGQQIMTSRTPLGSPLLAHKDPAKTNESLEPIQLTPGLLALIDPLKREALLHRWQTIFTLGDAVVPQAVEGEVE
ncbi:ABC transporter substrate-binding protein [Kushneria indalinina]|uniref:Iron(III) transport system substrate-binding protein n=1 Tax=Kushneria indalinina DSM 14324 TaxID=1122140 RepID=A0A3D9DUZ3_9GAMM|nr:ABC transporter substrate-binding protein [Kushneria indalinina]REC94501.1 iron(III) transport system substrate-binding protein [Kushneria indalinina DSM 14324]